MEENNQDGAGSIQVDPNPSYARSKMPSKIEKSACGIFNSIHFLEI